MSLLDRCTTDWDPFPTCLYGTCDSNVTNLCICHEGYIHDRVAGRYHNCGMPQQGGTAFISICLVSLLIGVLYCGHVGFYRSTEKTLSRHLAWNACAACLLMSIALITALASPNFETPWYGAICVCLATALFCRVTGLMVVASVRPIARFSRRGLAAKKYEIYLTTIIPGVLGILLMICLSVAHGIGTDESVSHAIGAAYMIIALAALIEFPFLLRFMGILLVNLKQLLELDQALDRQMVAGGGGDLKSDSSSFSTSNDENKMPLRKPSSPSTEESTTNQQRNPSLIPSTDDSSRITLSKPATNPTDGTFTMATMDEQSRAKMIAEIHRFRSRLALLRLTTCSMAIILFMCGMVVSTIQFTVGTVPLSFAIFWTILLVFAFLSIFITSYARRREKKSYTTGILSPANNNNNLVANRRDTSEGDRSSYRAEFSLSMEGPKLRTIVEASEHSRWSQT